MSLVVFTAFAGLVLAPGSLHPWLATVALLAIAVGAGAAGALNMWYDADIDARHGAHRQPTGSGRIGPRRGRRWASASRWHWARSW
jgi:heme o synthase